MDLLCGMRYLVLWFGSCICAFQLRPTAVTTSTSFGSCNCAFQLRPTAVTTSTATRMTPQDLLNSLDLQSSVDKLSQLPKNEAMVDFFLFYTVAELLAVPATPLTISAGAIFGMYSGTALVLSSAVLSASISFVIGRRFGRRFFEDLLTKFPKLASIDTALKSDERNSFKLMLLLRISPLLPFSLSNYFYGLTSIEFRPFFFGTALGFLPGTAALVYSGVAGRTIIFDSSGPAITLNSILVGGGAGLIFFTVIIKLISNVAEQALANENENLQK